MVTNQCSNSLLKMELNFGLKMRWVDILNVPTLYSCIIIISLHFHTLTHVGHSSVPFWVWREVTCSRARRCALYHSHIVGIQRNICARASDLVRWQGVPRREGIGDSLVALVGRILDQVWGCRGQLKLVIFWLVNQSYYITTTGVEYRQTAAAAPWNKIYTLRYS